MTEQIETQAEPITTEPQRYNQFVAGFLERGGNLAQELAKNGPLVFFDYYLLYKNYTEDFTELGRKAGKMFYYATFEGYAACKKDMRDIINSSDEEPTPQVQSMRSKLKHINEFLKR